MGIIKVDTTYGILRNSIRDLPITKNGTIHYVLHEHFNAGGQLYWGFNSMPHCKNLNIIIDLSQSTFDEGVSGRGISMYVGNQNNDVLYGSLFYPKSPNTPSSSTRNIDTYQTPTQSQGLILHYDSLGLCSVYRVDFK